jgi:hypothetical protein
MLDNRNSGRNGAAQPISGRKPADASHIRPIFRRERRRAHRRRERAALLQLTGEIRASKSKLIQGKSLHLLGFSWPNPDFSKGYGEKTKKSGSVFTRA